MLLSVKNNVLPVVWLGYFNKTSGGLNPGVPARGVFCPKLMEA